MGTPRENLVESLPFFADKRPLDITFEDLAKLAGTEYGTSCTAHSTNPQFPGAMEITIRNQRDCPVWLLVQSPDTDAIYPRVVHPSSTFHYDELVRLLQGR